MTTRVSPSQRIRAEIDELFGAAGDLAATLEETVRLEARLILQTALETEVTEFLARNRYERRRLATAARAGHRNGYAGLTIKTTAGPVLLHRPKLRGTTEAFASRLLGAGGDPDPRPGVAGHRRVHPGAVGPRRGGRPGRSAGPRGHGVQVDRLHHLPRHQAGSSTRSRTGTVGGGARVPVLGGLTAHTDRLALLRGLNMKRCDRFLGTRVRLGGPPHIPRRGLGSHLRGSGPARKATRHFGAADGSGRPYGPQVPGDGHAECQGPLRGQARTSRCSQRTGPTV